MPETAVVLPWGAWGSDTIVSFETPDDWEIVRLDMQGALELDSSALAARLDAPIGSPRIEDLAATHRTAAIAVDDLTRPTRAEPIVSAILSRLERGGLAADDIVVLIAAGAHRPLSAEELRRKLGSVVDRVRVRSHSQSGPFRDAGTALAGVPVHLNEAFLDADLRIGVGAVIPHPFAGFSGGGKVVVPGLADLDVLTRTHKEGDQQARADGARLRQFEELDQRARKAGHDAGEDDERRAVADAALRDLLAQPHQEHRAADQRDDGRRAEEPARIDDDAAGRVASSLQGRRRCRRPGTRRGPPSGSGCID